MGKLKRWIALIGIAVVAITVIGYSLMTEGVTGKTAGSFAAAKEEMKTVESEAELRAYFKELKKWIDANSRYSTMTEEATAESDTSAGANDMSAKADGGGDHSTTNNQVEGVDESDIVKTDGKYVYFVQNQKLTITDVQNPNNLKQITSIKYEEEFYPTELFLFKDQLIVLGDHYTPIEYSKGATAKKMMPVSGMTKAMIYDVSDASKPELIREIGTEGYRIGARMTDGILYFITSVHPNFWIMEEDSDVELRPHVYDSKKGELPEPMPYESLSILPHTSEGSYSVITSVDLNNLDQSAVETKGYLGGSQQLYMSKENLYLTANVFRPDEKNQEGGAADRIMIWNPGTNDTEIFKFALDGTNVDYQASAIVPGYLLNQFSMDEHDGHFRLVTTEGNMWDDKNSSKNHLFILDDEMKLVGSVEDLAKGERIYSARFMGDKAYMVTFRETDPLFVIDVATPTEPKVLGELKIPGFSNYLHPLDENHLIGFGYDTEAIKEKGVSEPRIVTKGMKISLFDVSDFHNPKEKDTEIIGGMGTYSPIQHDHKALFQHQELNLYGFPVVLYEETENLTYGQFEAEGALIYEITPENGIQLKGDLVKQKQAGQQYEEWERQVLRMIYVDDALYSISMKELNSYNLQGFKQLDSLSIK